MALVANVGSDSLKPGNEELCLNKNTNKSNMQKDEMLYALLFPWLPSRN